MGEKISNLGVGLYSIAEAARLLKTPRRTLARWSEGYVQPLRSGPKKYAPVIAAERDLTFGDLIELMYVRGFREVGVSLDDLRKVAAKYRQEWAEEYPFATTRFATDGRALLLKEHLDWKNALTGQHQIFFDEVTQQLVHVGNLTSEWRPLGQDKAVVLNPDRAFGKPIEDGSGAHTYVLSQALKAGEDAKSVAWWYDTAVQGVLDALRFEEEWQLAS
jgi:uncharacterized protein (DUF433 family)